MLARLLNWRNKYKTKRRVRAGAAQLVNSWNARVKERRRQWESEEAHWSAAVSAAVGSGEWRGTNTRTAQEMAGITARYDSAQTNDDNQRHWAMADNLSADAAANPSVRATLRNRSRYEIANNCYAMGVGESIANDFVGTGPRLHIDDDRFTDEERADIELKWLLWSYKINLPGKLRVMRKAKRADGEAFACKITNPNLDHPIKLDLRLIEADQVRFVDMAGFTNGGSDGIAFDSYGNPSAYYILKNHPGAWSYATGAAAAPWEFDIWDASQVIHWFRQDRPGQHRGLPEILAALPLYATLRRYTQAVLDAAETAADFAILLKTESGAMFTDADGNSIDSFELAAPFSATQLERRMMATLPAGYDAKQMQPNQPTQQYGEFKREVCAEIGRCECVPTNMILADSSNNSFASGQLDHKIYFRTREIERAEADRIVLDDLVGDFIAEGTRIRDGDGDNGKPYLPLLLKDLGANVSHSWHWDSNEMGDQLKLAAAKSQLLRDGLTTIPAEYAAKGKDWQESFRAAARSLGITFEEYQNLVRNRIFADGNDALEEDAVPPVVKRPQQAAMQKGAK